VTKLLGGPPEEFPERYRQTSPIELLPLRVRRWLIHGARDRIVPLEQSKGYQAAAGAKGGGVRLTVLDDAGHFEPISPQSSAWPAVREAVQVLLKR
jgi:pimeloyl-ACP methyl ester carboxylesterase